MRFFVTASSAPKPKSAYMPLVALVFAAIILSMAVAQLFHFEDFVPLLESYGLPGGIVSAHLFASCIVVLEVAALPFLLRMPLSPAMRFVSMVSGWLVVVLWLAVQVYLKVNGISLDNSGLLGTVVETNVSWMTVFGLLLLGVLAAWISWGMWPLAHRKATR
ncbi:hypothetical protein D3C85_408840 [compost metagenome]